jgi:NCS1 family nucleobase:cation symporter-1
VIRRTRLSLRDLYSQNGIYSYTNGINFRAVVALVVAVLPCVPGFLHTVGLISYCPPLLDRIYTYAWFVTFTLAFALYWLSMLGQPQQENLNAAQR